MKRIIVAALLLFPVITLAMWVYWGMTQRTMSPVVSQTNSPVMNTNTNIVNTNATTNSAQSAKP